MLKYINIFNDFIGVLLTTVDAAYPLNKTECVEWHNKYREKHQVNNFSSPWYLYHDPVRKHF